MSGILEYCLRFEPVGIIASEALIWVCHEFCKWPLALRKTLAVESSGKRFRIPRTSARLGVCILRPGVAGLEESWKSMSLRLVGVYGAMFTEAVARGRARTKTNHQHHMISIYYLSFFLLCILSPQDLPLLPYSYPARHPYTFAVHPRQTLTPHHLHSNMDACGPLAHCEHIHCIGGLDGFKISNVWAQVEGIAMVNYRKWFISSSVQEM